MTNLYFCYDFEYLIKILQKKKKKKFNNTDGHDITEILLKVALSTITPTPLFFFNLDIIKLV